ncbi:methyl-accepting chemotaxis protein [Caulobacter soli]|uniref:methyl-accepting chemotaxis protein n=1 Tax=Caulobacter soli TaxID=2708539 RepID=UPI0013ED87C0|nr:methyl-accepting chemotaxis protein [Caulobacter soli]
MLRTINHKVMGAGAAVMVLCTASAGAGLWSTTRLDGALRDANVSAAVLRNHMEADMMHDALRADVLSSQLAGDASSGIAVDDVRKDLAEHTQIFRKAIADNDTLATDPASRAALAEIKAPLDTYIKSAGQMVDLAGADHAAAVAAMPDFMKQFSTLEGAMSDASDKIEAASTAAAARAKSVALFSEILMTIAVLAGVVFAGILIVISRAAIVRPVLTLAGDMRRLAAGQNDITVSGAGRADEIGEMAKSVEVFRQSGLERARLEAQAAGFQQELDRKLRDMEAAFEVAGREQKAVVDVMAKGLSSLAGGDLSTRIAAQVASDYAALKNDFNAAAAGLEDAIRTISGVASQIGSGTQEIAQASNDLSRRTEQQAASLEETAAALDEIAATVRQTADGATRATTEVASARTDAERSGQVVGQAVAAMGAIEDSSRQITQIIGVIDEIAFQTNLLALNAGVEAARAGDAGRGFAVVAQEVRALAQRSAEAAKEIKTLISTSSQQVGAGVDLVGQTGEALNRIVGRVAAIDDLVRQISSSSQEQASGLAEVNTAVNHMDQVVQQNAAMVEQATAATHSLKGETAQLVSLVGRFKTGGGERPAMRMAS